MAIGKGRLRSALGNDPLSIGIFTKTDSPAPQEPQESKETNTLEVSSFKFQESSFLTESPKEKLNLRVPIEINDWLDVLVKKGKRTHGRKIPKEVWIQAALEFFRSLPIEWAQIHSVDDLRDSLKNLESRIKKV